MNGMFTHRIKSLNNGVLKQGYPPPLQKRGLQVPSMRKDQQIQRHNNKCYCCLLSTYHIMGAETPSLNEREEDRFEESV